MTWLKHIWWRIRLVYHWRRLGMSKRRWRALPAIWHMAGEPPYALRYWLGWSPLNAAREDLV